MKRSMKHACQYSLCILLTTISAQSDGKLSGSIFETGLYFDKVHLDWKPIDKNFDLHTLDIDELRFSFSDMKITQIENKKLKTASLTFKGPSISLKGLTVNSNIRSTNWITEEKIRRLKNRESIPKESIELIANAIDLFIVDHDTLPKEINEIIINNYISMSTPPLNDYSWSYSLNLPEEIVSKPTQINLLPERNAIIYDWSSRSFQIDPKNDSLFKTPLVDWKYVFKIEDISQIFTSDMQLLIQPDSLEFELMINRGHFNISGSSLTAMPNDILDDRSSISLPNLKLETKDIALSGTLGDIPTIHRGNGNFRIRNFEIKIPDDLKEEPEIQSMLETMGIWNNSIMVRLFEFELNMINQFTGDIELKFHTPFIKISVIGDFSIRQGKKFPEIKLHNTLLKIHPISFGIRKWIKNWEKENGRRLTRQGATIVLKVDGPIEDPLIKGY